jgi:hypothetical protein
MTRGDTPMNQHVKEVVDQQVNWIKESWKEPLFYINQEVNTIFCKIRTEEVGYPITNTHF